MVKSALYFSLSMSNFFEPSFSRLACLLQRCTFFLNGRREILLLGYCKSLFDDEFHILLQLAISGIVSSVSSIHGCQPATRFKKRLKRNRKCLGRTMNGRFIVEGEEGVIQSQITAIKSYGGKSIENGICKQVTFFVRFLMQVPNWPRRCTFSSARN